MHLLLFRMKLFQLNLLGIGNVQIIKDNITYGKISKHTITQSKANQIKTTLYKVL